MDIRRSFTAMFQDPRWGFKLLLAFVFPLLIIPGPAVIGFWMQYVRNVADGHDDVLPEWSDFGAFWVRGILVILAGIVYVLVGLILFIIGIIPAVILLQAAVIEYAMTERAGSLFGLKTVWHHITTATSFWTALIVSIGLGIGVSIVSGIVSAPNSSAFKGLGFLVNAVLGLYVSFVEADLYGQYAHQAYSLPAPPAAPVSAPRGPYPPTRAPGGFAPPPQPQ